MGGAGSAWKDGEVWACGLCETARGRTGAAGCVLGVAGIQPGWGMGSRDGSGCGDWGARAEVAVPVDGRACAGLICVSSWTVHSGGLLEAVSSSTKRTWWSALKELVIFPRGHAPAGKRRHRWCQGQAGRQCCCVGRGSRADSREQSWDFVRGRDSLQVAPGSLWSGVCAEMLSCGNSPG